MRTRKPQFKIWDRQTGTFVTNAASLHCFSNWSIAAFSGEIIDFVGVVDGAAHGQYYTASPNPDCYAAGKKIVHRPRYELFQYTGMKDGGRRKIFEGDIVKSVQGKKTRYFICEWQQQNASFILKENSGKIHPLSSKVTPALKVEGHVRESNYLASPRRRPSPKTAR